MDQTALRIGNQTFGPKGRTLIMGILNATPDSFSDGGRHNLPEQALAHAKIMTEQGADIIDIGGESTRPGASTIDAEEEWARVEPVFARINSLKTLVSIDTYKAAVAEKALNSGAHIVNDVWGLQQDPAMADVVAQAGAAVVIMQNRHDILPDNDVLADMSRFFERSLEIALRAGVRQDGIMLDPGIGFGKSPQQNEIVLNHLAEFRRFGYPLLIGASRKRFIGRILSADNPEDRLYGTLGAHMIALAHGADILRVHDVRAHADAVRVADAILRKGTI